MPDVELCCLICADSVPPKQRAMLDVSTSEPSPPPNEHLGLFWREKYPKFVLNATIGVKIPTR